MEEIQSSPLKPYVSIGVHLSKAEERAVFGKFPSPRGLTPEHFLKVARKHTEEANRLEPPEKKSLLSWPSSKDLSVTDTSVTDVGTGGLSVQGGVARS